MTSRDPKDHYSLHLNQSIIFSAVKLEIILLLDDVTCDISPASVPTGPL